MLRCKSEKNTPKALLSQSLHSGDVRTDLWGLIGISLSSVQVTYSRWQVLSQDGDWHSGASQEDQGVKTIVKKKKKVLSGK